ncbi:MAG TPA: caspase family protein [Bryobacteraceae bacterium]|nr:caspase family protein [Bryobacteraceae bacterium]
MRKSLLIWQSVLDDATTRCPDSPSSAELWFYLKLVAAKTGDSRTAARAARELDDLEARRPQGKVSAPDAKDRFDLFAPLPPTSKLPNGRPMHKWALVIGINGFARKEINSLQFAVKDSADFAAFLTDPNGGRFDRERVQQRVNEQATYAGIREGIGWLRAHVQEQDMVVVYIASHGGPRKMDPNGMSFIVTFDTDLRDAETQYATSLGMIDLVQTLNREIRAAQVVLVLDTCYSGGAQNAPDASRGLVRIWPSDAPPPVQAPSSQSFSAALESFSSGRGRAVITSARADERAFEGRPTATGYQPFENGFFTGALLQELRQDGASRPLSAVLPAVRDQVSKLMRQWNPAFTQTPTFEFKDQAGAISLGVPETAAHPQQ